MRLEDGQCCLAGGQPWELVCSTAGQGNQYLTARLCREALLLGPGSLFCSILWQF